MIRRIWHGWTSRENVDKYLNVLTSEVIPNIEHKNIPWYRGIEVLRKNNGEETEFITIMTFDSLQSVIDFQGEDYTHCYVPEVAQAVLERWDRHSSHYDAVEQPNYS